MGSKDNHATSLDQNSSIREPINSTPNKQNDFILDDLQSLWKSLSESENVRNSIHDNNDYTRHAYYHANDVQYVDEADEIHASERLSEGSTVSSARSRLRQLEQNYRSQSFRTDSFKQQTRHRVRRRSYLLLCVVFMFLFASIIVLAIAVGRQHREFKRDGLALATGSEWEEQVDNGQQEQPGQQEQQPPQQGEGQQNKQQQLAGLNDSEISFDPSHIGDDRVGKILDVIGAYTSNEVLAVDTTPQYQALLWLAQNDLGTEELGMIPDHVIIDRYVMAVLYFATNGPAWLFQLNFLSGPSVCQWNEQVRDATLGVHCYEDEVIGIFIDENNLRGSIPTELKLLSNLQVLVLDKNELVGSLPTQFGTFTNLSLLSFIGNPISGPMPTEYGNLSNLRYLGIAETGSNGIAGPLPSELGKLALLEYLWVHENGLTESIPTEFVNLTSLNHVRLENNALTGSLNELFCDHNGGNYDSTPFSHLSSDCGGESPQITCSCCTFCFTI